MKAGCTKERLNMDEQIISMIQQGSATAFIDGTMASNLAYRPQFVSNNMNCKGLYI